MGIFRARHALNIPRFLFLTGLLLAGCGLVAQPAPLPSAAPSATIAPATPTVSTGAQVTLAPGATLAPTSTTGAPEPSLTPAPTQLPAAAQYVVLIVLDGCRPDYFDLADLPNLQALIQAGSSYPDAWVGQLDSNTAPGHTTMSTGSFPNHHDILSFNWLSPLGSISDPTGDAAVNKGEMADIVRASGVPTLAGLIKERYPDGIVAAVSATKAHAAMGLGSGPTDIILYGSAKGATLTPAAVQGYAPSDEILNDPRLTVTVEQPGQENLFAARAGAVLVEKVRPRALLLNFSATDVYGHSSGGKIAPSLMRKVMQNSDKAVGELVAAYRQAGIFDQTLWVIVSDHGMIPNSHLIDPQNLESVAADAGMPGNDKAPYVFLSNPLKSQKLAEAFAAKHLPGFVAVYYKLDLRDGVSYLPAPSTQAGLNIQLDATYRYLLSTVSGPTAPDVVITTAEDAMVGTGEPNTSGSHGWITWGDQHIPLILSGPGVQAGAAPASPARLVDLLPTIARLMGLPEASWDGLVLADALSSPTPEDQARQAASNDLLQVLRDKLKATAGNE